MNDFHFQIDNLLFKDFDCDLFSFIRSKFVIKIGKFLIQTS